MPKKQILGMCFILVLLSLVCNLIYDKYEGVKRKTEIIEEPEHSIIGEKSGNSLKLYYTDTMGINYYLYGLDNVTIDYGDRILELDRALEAKQVSIAFMIDYIGNNHQVTYKDGGSILIHNDKIALLQCHTVDGVNDYYFGPSNMKYKDGFCKEKPYICDFTRTYQVLHIMESENPDYIYLTLKKSSVEEIETVKVLKEIAEDITENEFYEFQFGYLGNSRENKMKSLFENNRIISITHTDKQETEQVNEKICK